MEDKGVTVRAWFRLDKRERARRVQEYKQADRNLQAYQGPDGSGRFSDEDPGYNDLNDRVNELWPTVPWFHRTAWTA